jgi:peptidyl-prolyl cis-trans isomerase C
MAQIMDFSTGWVMKKRIVLVLSMACVLSACDRKAEGQTVAVVNKEEITSAELNAELGNNQSAGTATQDSRAAALQRIIDRRLLAEQARTDGIDKSPEFLNQQRRMTEELLINMLLTRQANTAQMPTADEVNRFEAAHPEVFANHEIWTLQQIIFPSSQDPGLNAKIAAAKTLDQVAQVLTAANVQFTRNERKVDTSIFPTNIYNQVVKIKDSEPFIVPGPNKVAASVVTAREPAPIPADQARTLALNGIKREKMQQTVEDRLKSLRASAKIEYQQGFAPPKAAAKP